MAILPDIKFNISPNGLGRPLDGKDHYSGMLFYAASYPSGFSSTNKINKVFALSDVEALGIVGTFANETKATGGNFAMSVTSAVAGNTVAFKVTALNATKTIYTYTFSVGDTATSAAAIVIAGVNAGTNTHGFVASGSGINVAIAPPFGYGSSLNAGSQLTAIVTGAITAPTITQFTGGINDPFIQIWYHCKRYFLRQPLGVLWLGIFPSTGTLDFAEITLMQNFASGDIRLMGVWDNINSTAFATTQITALEAQANSLAVAHVPLDIFYTPNVSASSLSSLVDLSTLFGQDIVVDIAQDGANVGASIYAYLGKSLGSLGCLLGTAALAPVSNNLGWIAKYNVAVDDAEFNVPAFSNGVLYRDQNISLITSLYSYHWTFIKTHIGISGTYYVDDKTCVIDSSPYAALENNRTIKKAIRNVRTALLPQLSGPIPVDSVTGKLTQDYIAYITTLANAPLAQMEKDGDLSGYEVIINPSQNVLSSSTVTVTLQLVPIGVSRQFTVNIGFVTKVS